MLSDNVLNITEEGAKVSLESFGHDAIYYLVTALLCLILFFLGRFLINLFRKIIRKGMTKKGREENTIKFVDSFIKYSLMAALIGSLAIELGVQATAIATLLGSVGVAIGLAIQGSLANFAGGVLIIALKPFKVGDYIIEGVKGREGKVIEISLIYTKILTYNNEVIILPNGTLANSDTVNLTAHNHRRVELNYSIAYESDIKKARDVLNEVLVNDDGVLEKPEPWIVVSELGESSVTMCTKFYVKSKEYWTVYYRVLENGKLALDKAGITIPFNQLDVHIK